MTPYEQVTEFHRTFGCAINQPWTPELGELRARLITEECRELDRAFLACDQLGVAQELADLTYVVVGTAVTFDLSIEPRGHLGLYRYDYLRMECAAVAGWLLIGDILEVATILPRVIHLMHAMATVKDIDLDAAITEVHRANMSKLGPDGNPIRRSDGKVLKGPNFVPPDMTGAIGGERTTTVTYLAGPMTGMPDWNRPAFHTAAKQLRARGHIVINPAQHGLDETDWATCMRRGLRELLGATTVVVLPGWEQSRGASLEVYVAEMLGMRVRDLADVLDAAGAPS